MCIRDRFPDGKAFAPVPADLLPGMMILAAHSVGQAQVRRKNIELPVQPAPCDGEIPHAPVPIICPEHRTAAVHRLPVKAVPAHPEIDLLPVRGGLFPEMYE